MEVGKKKEKIKYIKVTDLKKQSIEVVYKMISEYDRIILMTNVGPIQLILPQYK